MAAQWVEWLALGVIPWWLYVVASIAAAVTIVLYVPNKLGLVLALLAALAIGDMGWTAKGYSLGAAQVEAKWQGYVAAEKKRLDAAFKAGAEAEAMRAGDAQQKEQELDRAVNETSSQAERLPGAGDVVIPESVTRKLYQLRGRR